MSYYRFECPHCNKNVKCSITVADSFTCPFCCSCYSAPKVGAPPVSKDGRKFIAPATSGVSVREDGIFTKDVLPSELLFGDYKLARPERVVEMLMGIHYGHELRELELLGEFPNLRRIRVGFAKQAELQVRLGGNFSVEESGELTENNLPVNSSLAKFIECARAFWAFTESAVSEEQLAEGYERIREELVRIDEATLAQPDNWWSQELPRAFAEVLNPSPPEPIIQAELVDDVDPDWKWLSRPANVAPEFRKVKTRLVQSFALPESMRRFDTKLTNGPVRSVVLLRTDGGHVARLSIGENLELTLEPTPIRTTIPNPLLDSFTTSVEGSRIMIQEETHVQIYDLAIGREQRIKAESACLWPGGRYLFAMRTATGGLLHDLDHPDKEAILFNLPWDTRGCSEFRYDDVSEFAVLPIAEEPGAVFIAAAIGPVVAVWQALLDIDPNNGVEVLDGPSVLMWPGIDVGFAHSGPGCRVTLCECGAILELATLDLVTDELLEEPAIRYKTILPNANGLSAWIRTGQGPAVMRFGDHLVDLLPSSVPQPIAFVDDHLLCFAPNDSTSLQWHVLCVD